MEASAIQARAGLARTPFSLGGSLLRLRSDEQLVALFRDGNDEAFRVIHDRYRTRLFAYTRQMLPGSRQDAEDALQDIFVRAYSGLRANDRELALRAWLYRVAHNRCIDELRRPAPPVPEVMDLMRSQVHDPVVEAEQRESLHTLIADLRRLPEQQRSALMMRELGGIPYNDIAAALGISVSAVKSLLVRARVGLAQALEARDTACSEIREELILAHDRGVRPSGVARRHIHDCAGCREFRAGMRGVSRQFAALAPVLGPIGVLANLLGFGSGGGAAASGGAAAGGSAAAAGGVVGTSGAVASAGFLATSVSHVATLLAAAVVTAGGAVEVQHVISAPAAHHNSAHSVKAAVELTAAAQTGPEASTAAANEPATSAQSPSTANTVVVETVKPQQASATPTQSLGPSTQATVPPATVPLPAADAGAGTGAPSGSTSATATTGSGSTAATGTASTGTTATSTTGAGSPPTGTTPSAPSGSPTGTTATGNTPPPAGSTTVSTPAPTTTAPAPTTTTGSGTAGTTSTPGGHAASS